MDTTSSSSISLSVSVFIRVHLPKGSCEPATCFFFSPLSYPLHPPVRGPKGLHPCYYSVIASSDSSAPGRRTLAVDRPP
jgi:hypothetical protein